MQGYARPLEQLSLQQQQNEEGSADDRLAGAAERAVKAEQQRVKDQPEPLRQAQQAEDERQEPDQDADVEAADGQYMGDAQTREGGPVLRGDQLPHAQQHGGGVAAGLFTHTLREHDGKPVAKGSREAGPGEEGRIGDHQPPVPVEAYGDAPAKQLLPEIIAVRIGRAVRVVQGGVKGDRAAGGKTLRHFRGIKGPVRAGGKGTAVQRDVGKDGFDLAVGARADLIGDDAGDLIFRRLRQRRTEGEEAGKAAGGQRDRENGGKAEMALQQEAARQPGGNARRRVPRRAGDPPEQYAQREADGHRRQQPSALPRVQISTAAPGSARRGSEKRVRASRRTVFGE